MSIELGAVRRYTPAPAIRRLGREFPDRRRVAVVGGGFSGTLVAANLVATTSAEGFDIDLFERFGGPGAGTAYRTNEGLHLLNVPAGNMGAFSLAPEDFLFWLRSERSARARALYWTDRAITAADYVPRALYRCYLQDILAKTLKVARQRDIRVRFAHASVIDIIAKANGAALEVVTDNARTDYDAVVLATGHLPPRPHATLGTFARRSPRYIGDIWHPEETPRDRIALISRAKTALILGTGLTAVDAVLALRACGFSGEIIAVSRHGHLPNAQLPAQSAKWTFSVPPGSVPRTALGLLQWLRRETQLAAAEGVDWRAVVDALRPFTQTLWKSLTASERKKILRRLSLWNVHRHRMAPEIKSRIDALVSLGVLQVRAARVLSVKRRLGGFSVRLKRKDADAIETIRPALILNCTGPELNLTQSGNTLLVNLLRRHMIESSEAGGVAARDGAAADGENCGRLFAVGPLLTGELFESTAVPELRDQADETARRVLERLNLCVGADVTAAKPGRR